MSFGKTKLILSFALFGFLIGVTTYFVLDIILGVQPAPILEMIKQPWFLSGIAGSFLSVIAVYLSARFTGEN